MIHIKNLLVLLLILVVSFSFAQQISADAFLGEYNKCTVDSTKIDLLIKYSNSIISTEPKKSIYYSKIGLKLALERNDVKKTLVLYETLGRGYQYLGDISKAIYNFSEANKIAKKHNDKEGLAYLNLYVGYLYAFIDNNNLAIEYYKSAIDYFVTTTNYQGLCRCYINISDALYNSNKIDEALYYLQKAKLISEQHNGYRSIFINTNFAETYLRKRDLKLAEEYANKGMVESKKQNNLYILSSDYLLLSKVYFIQNRLKLSEQYAKMGLSIAKRTSIQKVLIDSYSILYKVLDKEEKYKESAGYKTLLLETKDSIQSSINNNLLEAFEYKKRDEEIADMKAEGMQKNAELKQQKLVSEIIALTLFIVLCITGYVFYSRNKLRKTTLELKKAYREISTNREEIVVQNQELLVYNEQIIAQSKRIKELNNLKDRLFAIISHDLRRPFNNLSNTLRLLVAGSLSEQRIQTIIPLLIKSMSSVSELLDNLLQWSNSQLKGETIEESVFNMNDLVKKQIELFETQASEKQIVLKNEINKDISVFADRNLIDIVMRNLVSNAIKFCNESGEVIISGKQQADRVEISVKDKGVGISPENIDKIFQDKGKFTTLGTNKEQGTGIGLMLCKDFIEKQNGSIGVESTINEGSRFWFILPSTKVNQT